MNKYLLLFILFLTLKASAQTCPPNIGFENGDFTNWDLSSGYVSTAGVYELTATGSTPVVGRQQIINKSNKSVDPYGGFPVSCPNGSNYSIQLGNTDVRPPLPEGSASRISYTFVVPTNQLDYTIVYNYAIVLQDPAPGGSLHTTPEKPLFSAEIYDVESGQYITCASFSYNAGSSLPGFTPSPFGGSKGIVYTKGWTQSSISLRGYGGKTVKLEFTARDCTPGGHFGYAYIDVNEPCGAAVTGNNSCVDQNSIKLYAPTGFSQYNWYNASFTKLLGTGPALTLSPVPANGTRIALATVPYAGLGCPDTIYTVINAINASFNFVIPDSVGQCPDQPTYDLTAASVKTGSDNNLTYTYYTDPDGLNFLPNPNAVTSGTYYIKAVNPSGCSGILPIHVVISNPIVKINFPAPVTYPAGVDLSGTFVKDPNLTYSYYYDPLAKRPIPNFSAIHYTGSYYIKATSKFGCYTISRVYVTVYPPPPPVVTSSNTFSPNGDGVNDTFSIGIKGFGAFKSLKICNRYGQEVFSSTDITTAWDGTYKGKPVPVGTYYWVFIGENTYDRSSVHEGGAVTLVR
jgi:gliding motility-associated-like protein